MRYALRFVGSPAELRKETISFVCLSVRLSVRMEQLGPHLTEFHEIWYLNIFRKSVEKIQDSLKHDKNNVIVREDQFTFMIVCRFSST